ncbi:hypothetical protein [Streptomyces sp. PTY087I2]|uniref:hypothetical protein n=1 Tax=Streptomyces sp. PTY087I2 TaxID=1819298 RepID=UPI0008274F66|nr:hypothetical protein [Streptomyces sp. PTY087I2]OCC13987.1 hypothetical protein A3Q37_00259 [Streptomyces sp. PTY087I2]
MVTYFRRLLDDQGIRSPAAFLHRYKGVAASLEGGPYDLPAEKTIEGWLYQERRPQNAFRPVIVAMLGMTFNELWQEAPEGAPLRGATTPATPPFGYANSGMAVSDMRRTGAMAVRRARKFLLDSDQQRVGENSLPLLHTEVTRLVREYPRVPLGDIWEDLLDAQDQVLHLIETRRFNPSQLRDVNFLAAVVGFLVAKGFNDLEDRDQARTMALVAASSAKDAEHPGLLALIKGLQSLIEYWADRPTDAFFYAKTGADTATNLRGSVGPWLLGLQARASARLGDEETVRIVTAQADDLRERVVPDDLDELGGLLTYSRTKQLYYTVEAEALLGHGDATVIGQAEEAVAGFSDVRAEDWAFGDLAGAQCNLSLVHLHSGDVDGAAEAIRPVLDLSPALRNNGIVVSASRVQEALRYSPARTAVTARELSEEITAFPPQRRALMPGRSS